MTPPDPKPTPEEIRAAALRDADRIRDEARRQAERILAAPRLALEKALDLLKTP